jgi:competence CoiA-like predicted nuclease
MKTLHEKTQERILEACKAIGLQAEMEYRGKGWRADVFASNGNSKYAFEVQLSPQTLKRTQERQEKYIRDGIVGCWLFENEPARQRHELEGLPIFKLEDSVDDICITQRSKKITYRYIHKRFRRWQNKVLQNSECFASDNYSFFRTPLLEMWCN